MPRSMVVWLCWVERIDRIKRVESAQQNSIEHLPLFLGGLVFATVAGVDNAVINTGGWVYTAMRVG